MLQSTALRHWVSVRAGTRSERQMTQLQKLPLCLWATLPTGSSGLRWCPDHPSGWAFLSASADDLQQVGPLVACAPLAGLFPSCLLGGSLYLHIWGPCLGANLLPTTHSHNHFLKQWHKVVADRSRVYLCVWAQLCQYLGQAWSGRKAISPCIDSEPRSAQWPRGVLRILLRGWMDFPRPPKLPAWEGFLLSLVKGQSWGCKRAGFLAAAQDQIPEFESGREEKMTPKSHCLAACSTLMIPLVWGRALDRGQDPPKRLQHSLWLWRSPSAREETSCPFLPKERPSDTECPYVPGPWEMISHLNGIITLSR